MWKRERQNILTGLKSGILEFSPFLKENRLLLESDSWDLKTQSQKMESKGKNQNVLSFTSLHLREIYL
jgi:hypothetical protein